MSLLAGLLFLQGTVGPAVAQEAPGREVLGEVEFPNSGIPEAQEPFRRGLLLLHNFEYQDARAAFLEAQGRDPSFAMAYWGEALTYDHPLWGEEDLEAARGVLRKLERSEARPSDPPGARSNTAATEPGGVTFREAGYIDAVRELFGEGTKSERDARYAAAMARLSEAYPQDVDAAALYALALLGTAEEGRDFTIYMKAAAVLEELIDRYPRHPGVLHYMIHAYDDPVHAPLGLRAARAYADVAADAVHALHMPSHIFFALGMWKDVVRMNERSWQASVDRADRLGLGPEAHSYHALWWLHYAYLQRGRMDDASRLLDVAEDALRESGAGTVRYHRTQMRAAQIIADPAAALETGLVDEALADTATGGEARISSLLAGGLALLEAGRVEEARDVAATLSEIENGDSGERNRISDMLLRGALEVEAGDLDRGLALLGEAAEAEASMPYSFGPPLIVKPASELLGESLLRLGRTHDARAAFERALERMPGRRLAVEGLAAAAGE